MAALEGEVTMPVVTPATKIRSTADLTRILVEEINLFRAGQIDEARLRSVVRGVEGICRIKATEHMIGNAAREGVEVKPQLLLPNE
jgi:hypothetical protein